ncbi:hypothetical protein VV11_020100, partial [Trichodesmium erythraeum 21-75]|nr:hypothetical protein [Trichodesmium erythraeum 21-75]
MSDLFHLFSNNLVTTLLIIGDSNSFMKIAKLKKFVNSIIQERKYSLIIRERIKQIPIIQEMDRVRESSRYQETKKFNSF